MLAICCYSARVGTAAHAQWPGSDGRAFRFTPSAFQLHYSGTFKHHFKVVWKHVSNVEDGLNHTKYQK